MTNLEINNACRTIETIEDLTFQKESILETIEINECSKVKEVMQQMVNIVTASNFEPTDRDELVERSIDDINTDAELVDNSDMYAEISRNCRPSSMR